MSYIEKKTRLFNTIDEPAEVPRKRSDGRLKTYHSATDTRAWSDITEEQRVYILDLVRQGGGKGLTLGKYIPIDVLIDTLLANKNAEIVRLQNDIKLLRSLMTAEQIATYERQRAAQAGDATLSKLAETASKAKVPTPDPAAGRVPDKVDSALKREDAVTAEDDVDQPKVVMDKGAAKPAKKSVADDAAMSKDAAKAATEAAPTPSEKRVVDAQRSAELNKLEEQIVQVTDEQPDAKLDQTEEEPEANVDDAQTRCDDEPKIAGEEAVRPPLGADLEAYTKEDLKQMIISKDAELISYQAALAAKEEDCANQRQLARIAIEKLETVKDIIEERNTLKKKLEESEHELETLRQKMKAPKPCAAMEPTATCEEEIRALEDEIACLRSSSSDNTPERETEIIRKELIVLKKYCAKLSAIQAENNQLKRQIGASGGAVICTQPTKNADRTDDYDESDDKAATSSRVADLEQQLKLHKETIAERDRLRSRVQQLEEELKKYGGLPAEIEVLRKRSSMLDEIMTERDSLHARLNQLHGIEQQVADLKKRAARVDELERQMKDFQSGQRELQNVKAERDMLRMKAADYANAEQEIERLRYRAKEAEVLRIERDRMKVRLDELAAVEVEFMQVLERTKCLETIKAEREMYKCKYEQLLGLECECERLRSQVDRASAVAVEKDMLEGRLQECECLLTEQEHEIGKLLNHIDRLSEGHEEQQDRLRQSLMEMRTELSQKAALISTSEEQLAAVQHQLKSTIANVSTEANTMKNKLEHYERHVHEAEQMLREKQQEIDYLHGLLAKNEQSFVEMSREKMDCSEMARAIEEKDALIERLRDDLQRTRNELNRLHELTEKFNEITTDDHLQTILHQSKLALRKVAEELANKSITPNKSGAALETKSSAVQADLPDGKASALIHEAKKKCQCLSNEVKCLKAQECQLIKRLRTKEEQQAALEKTSGVKLAALQAENDALKKHSSEVQEVAKEQITELAQHLRRSHEKIEQLQSAVTDTSRIVSLRQSESCAALKEELDRVTKEKEQLEHLLNTLVPDSPAGNRDVVTTMRNEYADLEEQLRKEIRLRQDAEHKIKELEALMGSMGTESGAASVQLTLIRENDALKVEIERLKREVDLLTRALGCDLDRENVMMEMTRAAGVGGVHDDVRGGIRDEIRGGVRDDIRGGVREEAFGGVRDDVRDGVREDTLGGVRDDVRDGIRGGVREEALGGIRDDVRDGVRGGVREEALGGIRDDVRDGVRGGVREEDLGGIRDDVRVGVRDDIRDGVRDDVRGGVRDDVRGGVREGIRDEARDGVRGGVRDDVRDGVRSDVRDGVRDDVRDGVRGDLRDGVSSDVRDGVRSDVRDGIRDDVRDGVRSDVRDGVRSDVRDGVRDDIRDGVRGDVRDGVRDDVREGVRGDVREGVRSDVHDGVRGDVRDGVREEIVGGVRDDVRGGPVRGEAHDDELERLRAENVELRRVIDDLKKRLVDTARESPVLADRVDAGAPLKEPLAGSRPGDGLKDLSSQLEECQKENERLRRQIDELLGAKPSDKEKQLEVLKEPVGPTGREIAGREETPSKYKKEADDLRKKLEELQRELERLRDTAAPAAEKLAESPSKYKREADDLRRQLAEMQKELDSLRSAAKSPDESASAAKKEADDLRKQLAQRDKEMEAAKSAAKPAEEGTAALKKEADDLRKQLAEMQKELETSRGAEKSAESPAKYKDEADDLRKRLADMERDFNNLKAASGDAGRLSTENEQLKKELQDLRKLLDELDAIKAERDRLKKQLDDANKLINDLSQQIKVATVPQGDEMAQKQLDKETKEKDELLNVIGDLEDQLKRLKEQSTTTKRDDEGPTQAEFDKMKRSLAEAEAKAVSAVGGPGDGSEIDRLRKLLQDAEAKAEKCETKLQETERALKATEQQLRDNGIEPKPNASKGMDAGAIKTKEAQERGKASEKESDDTDGKWQTAEDATHGVVGGSRDDDKSEFDRMKRLLEDAEKRAQTAESLVSGDDKEALSKMRATYDDELAALKARLASLEKENTLLKEAAGGDGDWLTKLKSLQDELEKQKRECQDTITALKAQYDRDIRNLHTKHNDSVAKLQSSHEEIVKRVHSDAEKEVETLRDELVSARSHGEMRRCNCGPPLDGIVRKMMNNGMGDLNFEELQFLHTKTCEATAALLGKTTKRRDDEVADSRVIARRTPRNDRDVSKRQKTAQDQVQKLHLEINLERQRLEELKFSLDIEKDRNVELTQRLRAQNKTVCNMQLEQDIMRKKNAKNEEKMQKIMESMEKERSKIRALEDILEREKGQVKELKTRLEKRRTPAPSSNCQPDVIF